MNLLSKAIIVTSVMLAGSFAQADQCSYVSKEYAQKAMNLLNDSLDSDTKIVSWCEPCGQARPAKGTEGDAIKTVAVAHTGYQDYYEIQINGKSVDMAYTYIAGLNLAKYINIKAGMASETAGQACDLQGVQDEL